MSRYFFTGPSSEFVIKTQNRGSIELVSPPTKKKIRIGSAGLETDREPNYRPFFVGAFNPADPFLGLNALTSFYFFVPARSPDLAG